MVLQDRYARLVDYIRVSVTDRCNLRCLYCMPYHSRPVRYKHILTYEEILRVLRIAARLGVMRVRFTGGEPLARKNIQFLIRQTARIPGIEEVCITTNGVLLHRYVDELKDAGLKRINVSLDSLNPDKYREITGGGDLRVVLDGIERADAVGIRPIQLNVVVIRGINDDEIETFGRFTLNNEYHVRFIEFMPGKGNNWTADRCVTVKEIKERLEKALGPLEPVEYRSSGPACYYRIPSGRGLVGFISPVSEHFCGNCNRLRITSDGKVRPCLFSETEIDLRAPLRSGATDEEIERLLRLAVEAKPEGHLLSKEFKEIPKAMSEIGG